mgnify:CR=1 FL=1
MRAFERPRIKLPSLTSSRASNSNSTTPRAKVKSNSLPRQDTEPMRLSPLKQTLRPETAPSKLRKTTDRARRLSNFVLPWLVKRRASKGQVQTRSVDSKSEGVNPSVKLPDIFTSPSRRAARAAEQTRGNKRLSHKHHHKDQGHHGRRHHDHRQDRHSGGRNSSGRRERGSRSDDADKAAKSSTGALCNATARTHHSQCNNLTAMLTLRVP